MAFTSAPEKQTYGTHQIPMAWPLRLRPGNLNYQFLYPYQAQGEGMVNLLPVREEGSDTLVGLTRPSINGTYINNTAENGQVRGMHVWEKSAGTVYYFMVVGTKVYTTTDISSGANWSHVDTLLTSATTPVRFAEYIDSSSVKKLIMVDGVEGYIYTSNAAGTKIVDADFPTPHIPFPIVLDAYLFLAKANTGDIYNSNLDDPATWTAGDFISSEVYPDDLQALLKIDNYILAVGIQGSEFFYDAANATGSPLARDEGGILPFGCQFPNSIASSKNTAVMLANTNDGQSVFKVIEGMKHATIDSSGIVPMYNRMLTNPSVGWETDAAYCRGTFFRHNGELYYSFLSDGVRGAVYQSTIPSFCYVYSFSTKAWTELQYGSDTADRADRYSFPMAFTALNTTGRLTTHIAGNIGASSTAFFGYLDDLTAYDRVSISDLPALNQQLYQEWRTPNLDFGTMNRKFMYRLGYDVESHDSTVQPVIYTSWNDGDYNNDLWTDYIAFPTQSTDTFDYFPFITQLGQFRRRAIRGYSNAGKPLRIKKWEVDINKGQQ